MKHYFKVGENILYDNLIRELNYHCYFCDSEISIHKHHIIREKNGGLDTDDNIINLCVKCHTCIHHHDFYLIYSNGFFALKHRHFKNILIKPNERQLAMPRNAPMSSISNSESIGKIKIERSKNE